MKISLEGMVFYGYHGVLQEENKIGNRYEVTIHLDTDIDPLTLDDDIKNTVDYYKIYSRIQSIMENKTKLLETIAYKIATVIIENFPPVTGVRVQVTKYNPPLNGLCEKAVVEYEMKKE